MQEVLRRDFVGAYLQGSFAVGDFDQYSDVDFLICIHENLSGKQVNALQTIHARLFQLKSRWAQHLEGSYFPKDVLKQYNHPPEQLWYLDNGSSSLIQSIHCNTKVVRWVLREKGVTLAGPPPATLVNRVPTEELRREILEVIHVWGHEILENPAHFNNRFYQTFIVLSYCRMLHDYQAGSVGSKRTGAEWAKANLDPTWSGLIDRTWDGRPNPAVSVRQPADPEDFEKTLDFIRYVIDISKQVRIDPT